MSQQCANCTARAELYLCPNCIDELRARLVELLTLPDADGKPRLGLLECLRDEAIGRRKRGADGRHARTEPIGLDGDNEVLPKCTCGHPEHELRDVCGGVIPGAVTVTEIDDPDRPGEKVRHEERESDEICECATYRPVVDQAKLRARFLATGKVNDHAAELLGAVSSTLSTWARHIAESRGVEFHPLRTTGRAFVGPLLPGWRRLPRRYVATPEDCAEWLAYNVHSIALDEAAGEILSEIDTNARAIAKAIDLPTRRVWLGNCPTWNDHTRRICGVSLWAPEEAVEVYCPRCRGAHDPRRLKLMLFNDLEREKVPWEKILRANKSQPPDRQVSERTLQSWRRAGKLPIRGYKHRGPSGREREVINRHSEDDVPLYLWPDVRKLRDAKPQKQATGAAARRAKNARAK